MDQKTKIPVDSQQPPTGMKVPAPSDQESADTRSLLQSLIQIRVNAQTTQQQQTQLTQIVQGLADQVNDM